MTTTPPPGQQEPPTNDPRRALIRLIGQAYAAGENGHEVRPGELADQFLARWPLGPHNQVTGSVNGTLIQTTGDIGELRL